MSGKDILKLTVFLGITLVIAGLFLGMIYEVTKPEIEKQDTIAKIEARKKVLPMAEEFEEFYVVDDNMIITAEDYEAHKEKLEKKDPWQFFKGYKGGELVGYTFIAKKYGYSSEIQTMVGVDTDYTIQKIEILFQQETPGLGARCQELKIDKTIWDVLFGSSEEGEEKAPEAWYQEMYQGLRAENMIVQKISINEAREKKVIAAITGATITTKAISDSIMEYIEKLKLAVS